MLGLSTKALERKFDSDWPAETCVIRADFRFDKVQSRIALGFIITSSPLTRPDTLLEALVRKAETRIATHSHSNTTYTDVGTQSFTNPCALPEDSKHTIFLDQYQILQYSGSHSFIPVSISVHDTGENVVSVGAGTNE